MEWSCSEELHHGQLEAQRVVAAGHPGLHPGHRQSGEGDALQQVNWREVGALWADVDSWRWNNPRTNEKPEARQWVSSGFWGLWVIGGLIAGT